MTRRQAWQGEGSDPEGRKGQREGYDGEEGARAHNEWQRADFVFNAHMTMKSERAWNGRAGFWGPYNKDWEAANHRFEKQTLGTEVGKADGAGARARRGQPYVSGS